MTDTRPPLRAWIAGLVAFAIVIALGIWLRSASEFGIVDHQLAGNAERVDAIQRGWRNEGVRWLAILAMVGDLFFIALYSWGSWLAGRGFMRVANRAVRVIGLVVAAAAVLFLITDATETGLQLVQLLREAGSDPMARIAASMQGVKIASWIATFIGVLGALAIARFSSARA